MHPGATLADQHAATRRETYGSDVDFDDFETLVARSPAMRHAVHDAVDRDRATPVAKGRAKSGFHRHGFGAGVDKTQIDFEISCRGGASSL